MLNCCAAGCVGPEGMVVPPYSLVVGVPARVVRALDPAKRRAAALETAADYVAKAKRHAAGEGRST